MFLPVGFNLPFFRIPWVTLGWAAVCIVLFASLQLIETGEKILHELSVVPAVTNPFWHFFSYQFAHASWGHLVANLWYLFIFGWILENALGPLRFLISTLIFGGLAVTPEIIFQANPWMPIVGASGSVAYMMGATVALFPLSKVRLLFAFIPLPQIPMTFYLPVRYLAYLWLLMQVSGLAASVWLEPRPVAYATHLAGFGFGFLMGQVFRWGRKDHYVDIDLTGGDLKTFYQTLKNYQTGLTEEANLDLEKLSKKHSWFVSLQVQFLKTSILYQQRALSNQLWRQVFPSLMLTRSRQQIRQVMLAYLYSFQEMPPMEVEERNQMLQILKGSDSTPSVELLLHRQSGSKN